MSPATDRLFGHQHRSLRLPIQSPVPTFTAPLTQSMTIISFYIQWPFPSRSLSTNFLSLASITEARLRPYNIYIPSITALWPSTSTPAASSQIVVRSILCFLTKHWRLRLSLTISLPESSLRAWRSYIMCREERNSLSVWRLMGEGKRFLRWGVEVWISWGKYAECRDERDSDDSEGRWSYVMAHMRFWRSATCHCRSIRKAFRDWSFESVGAWEGWTFRNIMTGVGGIK